MGEGGFEPPKSLTTDLQSAPFGHSGIPPYSVLLVGAGRRTRTPDLLITNQLLYQLSYTSKLSSSTIIANLRDSREQFEQRTHKRLVILANADAKVVEALLTVELPAGVEIEAKEVK